MIGSFIRNLAVGLFGLASRLGFTQLPPFDAAVRALYLIYKKHFEAGPIDRLKEFVSDGSLVIDVGANVGFFSLLFATWVGNSGKVVAIEPEDLNYTRLVRAIERQGYSTRVDTLKAVATDTCGKVLLELNPVHPGDHKISRNGTGVMVSAVTLDCLARDRAGWHPTLIKIDVQGAELLVLMGASEVLKVASPAIFLELHEPSLSLFGCTISTILEHLSERGYHGYFLSRRGPHKKAASSEIQAAAKRAGYVDILFLKSAPNLPNGRARRSRRHAQSFPS